MIVSCLKYDSELVRTPNDYTCKYAKKEFNRVPPNGITVFEMLNHQRLFLGIYMKRPKNEVINQQVHQQQTYHYEILNYTALTLA